MQVENCMKNAILSITKIVHLYSQLRITLCSHTKHANHNYLQVLKQDCKGAFYLNQGWRLNSLRVYFQKNYFNADICAWYHPPNKKGLQANRTKQRKCIILHSSYGLCVSSINMTESMTFQSIICMSTICLYDD